MARKRPPKADGKVVAKKRGSSNLWPLLGALGLGAAAAALVVGSRRRGGPKLLPPARTPEASPEISPTPEPPARALGVLPDDAATSWLPGPVGGLRVVERNPTAENAVLFVHGLGGRAELWSESLAALGPGVRGVALDLPGHGESDHGAALDVETLAASIGAVADGLGLRRFVLVAHSLGASAALAYAASHSNRVSGLFLVDPTGDQSRQSERDRESMLHSVSEKPATEFEWQFRHLLAGSQSGVDQVVLDALLAASEDALVECFGAGLNFAAGEALEAYDGPICSAIGDLNDLPYSLHRLREDVEARPIFGASHWLMLDRPDEVNAAMFDFFERCF